MAAKRLSAGVYEVNGKRINAATAAEAEKKAGNSGKKKPSDKASADDAGRVTLDKSENTILKNVQGGQNLSNLLGFDQPLSRIGTEIPEDQRALIESTRQLSDPNSAAFVGRRSEEQKGVLSTLKDRVATAGARSQEMQDTLLLMKQGLAGLNAPENQALREQAQREVDRKYQTAVENLQATSRATGLGSAGRAGMRNARRDALGAQADLEQKNLLSNVDIQDSRQNKYADTLSAQETNEDQRYRNAIDSYRDQLNGTERDESDRVDRALNTYGGALVDRNNYFLDTSKVNLGQERTDRAAKVQSALGFAGLSETERQRRRALQKGKRRGGDGRVNPNGGGAPVQDPNLYGGFPDQAKENFYNDISNIYSGNG